MKMWFECRIKYEKLENCISKKVTESYILDAMTFSEAEYRIIEYMKPYISCEFEASAVKRLNISDIVNSVDGDKWYAVKINLLTIEEKTGSIKKKPSKILVKASSFESTLPKIKEYMAGSMYDYEIASIAETNIIDVFFM